MDVSADLYELGRTPVAVVCAGAKSILDIPRTLEVLESQGVAVAAWRSDHFPAFFTPRSGCAAPSRVDSAAAAARMIAASASLGLTCGMVLAVPIPQEAAAAGQVVEGAVQQALAEASSSGVCGRAVTPFLLKRVNELTGGASLAANVLLVKNNAAIGTQVAVELAALLATTTTTTMRQTVMGQGPQRRQQPAATATTLADTAAEAPQKARQQQR